MKTDIPLKRLTALRGDDLLPLLGLPASALVRVESRELPAIATRLDTVMRVRSLQGQEYLHLVEWQGYYDAVVLWRLAGYMAWLGQQEPGMPVVGTVVYLAPHCDVGDTLTQTIDGQVVQAWPMRRVQLWQQDAQAALASASLGQVVLSPLMQHADAHLVETAVQLVLQQAPLSQQGDLLSILGVFAEPLFEPQRFVALVGRERLMSSDLFDYLMKDREAELRTTYEAQLQQKDVQLQQKVQQEVRHELQQVLEDTLVVRFPDAPLALVRLLRRVQQPVDLRHLIVAVQQVPNLATAEQLLSEAAQQSEAQ